MNKELYDAFLALCNRLSPENLACDGEIPRAEINRRYRQCMKEWIALEKKAGLKVTETEIWNVRFNEALSR